MTPAQSARWSSPTAAGLHQVPGSPWRTSPPCCQAAARDRAPPRWRPRPKEYLWPQQTLPTSRRSSARSRRWLRAAIEGIKARGKSDVGDKTLLDALVPAVGTIEEQISAGHDSAATLRAAAATAREHAEATRSMQAMRGRASYTGERSIGTLDAGAVAVAVMFEALADLRSERSAQSLTLSLGGSAP